MAKPTRRIAMQRGDSTRSVYTVLQDMILSLQLTPGQKISEESLAELCGVSRTPVRDALFRLAAEGLVVLLPNRITQVAPLDISTVRDYLEGMDLIQRAVNRWAAFRRTPADLVAIEKCGEVFEKFATMGQLKGMVLANRDFHAAIAVAAKNDLIAQSYQRLLDVGLRIARFTLNHESRDMTDNHAAFIDDILQDHRDMLDAIARQDADRAEHIAVLHTERTRERFKDYLAVTGDSIRINDPDPAPNSLALHHA